MLRDPAQDLSGRTVTRSSAFAGIALGIHGQARAREMTTGSGVFPRATPRRERESHENGEPPVVAQLHFSTASPRPQSRPSTSRFTNTCLPCPLGENGNAGAQAAVAKNPPWFHLPTALRDPTLRDVDSDQSMHGYKSRPSDDASHSHLLSQRSSSRDHDP